MTATKSHPPRGSSGSSTKPLQKLNRPSSAVSSSAIVVPTDRRQKPTKAAKPQQSHSNQRPSSRHHAGNKDSLFDINADMIASTAYLQSNNKTTKPYNNNKKNNNNSGQASKSPIPVPPVSKSKGATQRQSRNQPQKQSQNQNQNKKKSRSRAQSQSQPQQRPPPPSQPSQPSRPRNRSVTPRGRRSAVAVPGGRSSSLAASRSISSRGRQPWVERRRNSSVSSIRPSHNLGRTSRAASTSSRRCASSRSSALSTASASSNKSLASKRRQLLDMSNNKSLLSKSLPNALPKPPKNDTANHLKRNKGANKIKPGGSFPRQRSRTPNRLRSRSNSRTRPRAGRAGSRSRSRSGSRSRTNGGRSNSLPRRSRRQTTPQNTYAGEYAGPTFYASPAPSSLPMPSNHTWPDSPGKLANSLGQHLVLKDLAETDEEGLYADSRTPSKSVPQTTSSETTKTPLDFLFDSARPNRLRARLDFSADSASNNASIESPSMARRTQVPSAVKDNVSGGMFHMEMESPAAREPPMKKENSMFGPSFARPYKERMEEYQMANHPQPPPSEKPPQQTFVTENQAKSAALKELLFRPSQPPWNQQHLVI